MTKAEVKTLIEGDEKLQWWAAVLFAEVCEIAAWNNGKLDIAAASVIAGKCREFERIVVGRMMEVAEGKIKQLPSIEERLAKLEAKVFEVKA